MKMPASMYADYCAYSSAATLRSSTQSYRGESDNSYRLPTAESVRYHPETATRYYEEPARQSRHLHVPTSRGAHPLRNGHLSFTATSPTSSPRPMKSVRWKEDHELATSIMIPNKEQNRELERMPEIIPQSNYGRRCRHHHRPHIAVHEPTGYQEVRTETRLYANAPAQFMLDSRGYPIRRR